MSFVFLWVQFLPVEVEHCPNAFGVSMTHTDGFKLVFSGDTMPCQRLVTAGLGAFLYFLDRVLWLDFACFVYSFLFFNVLLGSG